MHLHREGILGAQIRRFRWRALARHYIMYQLKLRRINEGLTPVDPGAFSPDGFARDELPHTNIFNFILDREARFLCARRSRAQHPPPPRNNFFTERKVPD